ncbi:uncharacterized protein LOC123504998 isoform X1 [Portunus trituberculatus]|uniref:uncharacterized protein LOC123504998 isoform X1 n=1 Tax=Portunus trituberculatus TaxID=210409 RepID=UPI001E1D19E7|nr:uncharacterized protein LOC123504998 isoform X1 [Portunus trituberculatus]XP_045111935.1 uncharacterized protein LOC123504998 isoform X1 [Portunus trituberculatus]
MEASQALIETSWPDGKNKLFICTVNEEKPSEKQVDCGEFEDQKLSPRVMVDLRDVGCSNRARLMAAGARDDGGDSLLAGRGGRHNEMQDSMHLRVNQLPLATVNGDDD